MSGDPITARRDLIEWSTAVIAKTFLLVEFPDREPFCMLQPNVGHSN